MYHESFLVHLAKGNVSFCYHLSSVNFSHFNLRGPSINASYQVSVHLASGFRGEDFFKSSNQKQELPVVAMFVDGSEQNEQSL
jgi:hypothetical protein